MIKLALLGFGGVAIVTSAYVIEKAPAGTTTKTVVDLPNPSVPAVNQTCPDGSVIPVASTCPVPTPPPPPPPPAPPPVQMCPDGSMILASATCPAPPPPAPPPPMVDPGIITIPPPVAVTPPTATVVACASLSNPAWAAKGPVNLTDTICTATKTCDSLLKPAGSTDPFPTLTAGKRYYVTPRTDGVTLPNGVTDVAVVAVPADGSIPTTMDQVFAASCFR